MSKNLFNHSTTDIDKFINKLDRITEVASAFVMSFFITLLAIQYLARQEVGMLSDAQTKKICDTLWYDYFDKTEKEYANTTDMVVDFEEYVRRMDLLDFYNFLCLIENEVDGLDTDEFDEFDCKLIQSKVSEGTDIWFKLNNQEQAWLIERKRFWNGQ